MSRIIRGDEICVVVIEASTENRLPRSINELEYESEVVKRAYDRAEELLRADEVRDIGTRKAFGARYRSLRIQRLEVGLVFLARDVDDTAPRLNRAVSADARGRHAVEKGHA